MEAVPVVAPALVETVEAPVMVVGEKDISITAPSQVDTNVQASAASTKPVQISNSGRQPAFYVRVVKDLALSIHATKRDLSSKKQLQFLLQGPDELVHALHSLRGNLTPLMKLSELEDPVGMVKVRVLQNSISHSLATNDW